MAARFPRRAVDGRFRVALVFDGHSGPDRPKVEKFLTDWLHRNGRWTRTWEGAVPRTEELRWEDSFDSPPHCVSPATSMPQELRIVLQGLPGKTPWKDWAQRLTFDLVAEMPGLVYRRMEDV